MDFFMSAKTIEDLEVNFNPDGWGPISGEKILAFDGVPYAHFDKKDKCGRAADFTQPQQNFQRRYNRRDDGVATEFSYKHDAVEAGSFQLVDSAKAATKKYSGTRRFQQNRGGGQLGRGGGRGGRGDYSNFRNSSRSGPGGRGRGGRGGYQRYDRKLERLPSLTVQGDWDMVEEFDLSQLLKLVANPPKVEDLVWCGHLDQYEESYDKMNTRTSRNLRRVDNKIFYDVTTADDPVLQRLAAEGVGDIFATDGILAQLMAAPRSIYSWDLVIEKFDGKIFLDKRNGSSFDFLTVSETARTPPTAADGVEEYNHPEKLSLEATMINQNFSQQVLKDDRDSRKGFEPNPFYMEEEDLGPDIEPASVAYRYRKFTLGTLSLVARCELHAWQRKKEEDQFLTVYALNEWDSKYCEGTNWRQKIDQQQGAVLATELKNNSCKFAKWTAQSIIAGADQMKLGFVSRVAASNPGDHAVLATQFFQPKKLADQINLSLTNIWGIVKMLAELLASKEDGKYVMLKDPNKATLRLYAVPAGTFEEELEGEAVAEEGEEGEFEEGEPGWLPKTGGGGGATGEA